MSTRSGKRFGGLGFLLDSFVTDHGEYASETVNHLVAHLRAQKFGSMPYFIDLSGNNIHLRPGSLGTGADFELTFSKDSPYNSGQFDRKALAEKFGSIVFPTSESPNGMISSKTSLLNFADDDDDRPFSVSFWIKNLDAANAQTIMSYGGDVTTSDPDASGGTAGVWNIVALAGDLTFYLTDEDAGISGNEERVTTTATVTSTTNDGDWHHVAVTYDGRGGQDNANRGMKIYLDGTSLAITRANTGNYDSMGVFVASDILCIGDGNDDGADEMQASMAEVAIFSKELTPMEIMALYEAAEGYDHAHSGDAVDRMIPGIRHRTGTRWQSRMSRIISAPPRLQLRELDHQIGKYPQIARTGDRDSLGKSRSFFDDTKTEFFDSSFAEGYIRFKEVPLNACWISLYDSRKNQVVFVFRRPDEVQNPNFKVIVAGQSGLLSAGSYDGDRLIIIDVLDLDEKYPGQFKPAAIDPLNSKPDHSNEALDYIAVLFHDALNKAYNDKLITLYAGISSKLGKINAGLNPADKLGIIDPEKLLSILPYPGNGNLSSEDPGKVLIHQAIAGTTGNTGTTLYQNQIVSHFAPTQMDFTYGWLIGKTPWVSGSFSGGTNLQVIGGSRLQSGSDWSQNLTMYGNGVPRKGGDILHPGFVTRNTPEGINETFHSTDDFISPFNDINLSSKFYGSPPVLRYRGSDGGLYVPAGAGLMSVAFPSPSRDKTMIELDITPSVPTSVWMSTGTAAHSSPYANSGVGLAAGVNSGLVYFNFNEKEWQVIGDLTSGSNVDICNAKHHIRTGSMLAFQQGLYARHLNEIGTGFDRFAPFSTTATQRQNIRNTGLPTNYAGFPVATKFDATGSQLIDMSNYITHPFLLEKVEIEWSGTVGANPTNLEDGMGIASNQFFILNQFGTPLTHQISRDDTRLVRHTLHVTESSPTFDCHRYKEVVWYGRASVYNSGVTTLGSILDASGSVAQSADLWISAVNSSSAPAGRFLLQSTAKVPSLNRQSIIGLEGRPRVESTRAPAGHAPIDLFFLGSDGSRDLFGTPSGRSYLAGTPGQSIQYAKNQQAFRDIGVGHVGSVEVKNTSPDSFSPYLLMPTDKLVIGYANQQIPHGFAQGIHGATMSPCISGSEVILGANGTNISILSPGAGTIRMFGSMIRAGKEFIPSTNQNLTSHAIHEAIHYDNPVLDQFLVEPTVTYSGSYLDDVVGGEVPHLIGGTDGVEIDTTYNRSVIASAVKGNAFTTGSLSRFRTFVDFNERFLDSMPGNPAEYHTINGKAMVRSYISNEAAGILALGSPNWTTGSLVVDTKWPRMFPFEPKFHGVERLRSISDFNKEFPTADMADTSITGPKAPMSVMLGMTHTPSFITDDKSFLPKQVSRLMMKFYFGIGDPTNKDGSTGSPTHTGFNHRGEIPNLEDPFYALFFPLGAEIGIRGWKYGLINGNAQNSNAVYRPDRFGQFRDLLEPRKFSRFFSEEDGHQTEPVFVKFIDRNTGLEVVDPEDTNAQNMSTHATSSYPFYDMPRYIPDPLGAPGAFVWNTGKMRSSLPHDMEPPDTFETSYTEAIEEVIG